MKFTALLVINIFAIHNYSYTHPFQGDTRRFTRYFHDYVIITKWKYAFAFAYTYLFFHYYELIKAKSTFAATGQHKLFVFAIFIPLFMTLVPTPLFDLRYFFIPWTMIAIEWSIDNQQQASNKKDYSHTERKKTDNQLGDILLNILHSALLSLFIVVIFIFFPFGEDRLKPGIPQRVIW